MLLALVSCTAGSSQVVEVTRFVPQTVEVTVIATPVPPVHTATASPQPGRLAFVSKMDGEVALYTINANQTGLTRLTHEPMLILHPTWSPDGMWIAFH
jgi:hypothetical protein